MRPSEWAGCCSRTSGREGLACSAFAAGAMLTMLADPMMPETFEHGGATVGLVPVLGFALAFLLSTLE